MSDFNFKGTALELCSRPGCCHYRNEHEPACRGPARGPGGIGIPGTHCSCPEFVREGGWVL